MTVWIIEHKCDDLYYSPYLECIFVTEELAKKYVASKEDYEQDLLEISEVEVLEAL